ncbi:MAG: PilZ domain-containing protein [Gammaproteobacteria bacterium]|nr:PilZ domain-containing protein [Gammaproteobacteria bacterium]
MNATATHDNRRRAYRYSPSLLMEPQLHVVHAGGRVPAIDVLDINARGARLRFTLSRRPELRPGEDVRVVAQSPGLDGLVDIPARVVFSDVRDNRLVAGLVFDDLPDVGERADGVFFSVFNRRAAERAERDAQALVARLVAPATTASAELEVVNRSEHGLGLLIDPALDVELREVDRVELDLARRGQPGDARVTAEIRHRVRRAGAVYYGCRVFGAS